MAKKAEKTEAIAAVNLGGRVKEGTVNLKKIEGPGTAVLALEDVGILRVGMESFPADFNPIDYDVTGKFTVELEFHKKG